MYYYCADIHDATLWLKNHQFDMNYKYKRLLVMAKVGFKWEYRQSWELSAIWTCLWQFMFVAKFGYINERNIADFGDILARGGTRLCVYVYISLYKYYCL